MATWNWCLVGDNKELLKGWQKVGDYWYYLKSNGAMATGWLQDGDRWYYLNGNGQMQTGWIQLKNKWYYLEEKSNGYMGEMYHSGQYEINGKKYTFDEKGVWIKDMQLSTQGAKFIESWEGYSSVWEDVGDGYWTIGIGTATSGSLGQQLYNSGIKSCTHDQAYQWLIQECTDCCNTIKSKAPNLSQNQLDALVSMAYNIGTSALLNSTLFKNICNGVTDVNTLYANFTAWSKCNGVTWQGLLNRRKSEYNLYVNGDYTGNC